MGEGDLFPSPHGGQGSIGGMGTMGSSQRLGAPSMLVRPRGDDEIARSSRPRSSNGSGNA
jgi:hypothetical protein